MSTFFDPLHVDGESVGAVSSYTFENVEADHTIAATFAIDTFTISASASANGSISPTGAVSVAYGDDATFTISPNSPGYHIAEVLVDGESVGAVSSYTFTNVVADHTITANFAINSYTLTYSAGTGGTLEGITSQQVNHGEDGTTVTAVPNTGYHFTGWSDGVSEASRTDLDIAVNLTVTANFAINTYTLTYSAGAGGSLEGAASQQVNHGEDGTTVTAVSNTGYHFTGWSDGVSEASRTDLDVTGDITVTANFAIDTFALNYYTSAGGNLTGQISQLVNYGADGAAVTAVPNTGYHFVNWSDGSTANPRIDTNVTANVDVTANFAINSFTITAAAGQNGYISPSGSVSVVYGAGQTFTFTANAGYRVSDVVVDGVSVGSVTSYTFENVSVDHSISVSFVANTLPVITQGDVITVTMGRNGAVIPFTLTLNATDMDSDTLTWSILTQAGHGEASADGTGASIAIGYTPTSNYSGSDSFVVQVSDGEGGTDTITVNVIIKVFVFLPLLMR